MSSFVLLTIVLYHVKNVIISTFVSIVSCKVYLYILLEPIGIKIPNQSLLGQFISVSFKLNRSYFCTASNYLNFSEELIESINPQKHINEIESNWLDKDQAKNNDGPHIGISKEHGNRVILWANSVMNLINFVFYILAFCPV